MPGENLLEFELTKSPLADPRENGTVNYKDIEMAGLEDSLLNKDKPKP